MSFPFVISDRVIKTVNALPAEERKIVSDALVAEFIRGENPVAEMSSLHAMIYTAIRYYVKRDTERSMARTAGAPMGVCAAGF